MKSNFKKLALSLMPKTLVGLAAMFAYRPYRSFATNGEDFVVERFFDGKVGTYVDVGCFHPRHSSNTRNLYKRGWRGINIDGDPYKIGLFKIFRGKDVNLCVAVSEETGVSTYYFHEGAIYGQMAGLDLEGVKVTATALGRKLLKRQVDTMPLNEILTKYGINKVDFLSVDVEGHEIAVLRSIDLDEFAIPLIAVEIRGHFASVLDSEPHRLLTELGYSLAAWTPPTVFYARGDHGPVSFFRRGAKAEA